MDLYNLLMENLEYIGGGGGVLLPSKLPEIQDNELLDCFIRGCSPPIRLELERAYSNHKGWGKSLEPMGTIRLAETENQLVVKKTCFFHNKNWFERKHLASLNGGGERGGLSSSDVQNGEEVVSRR